MMKGVEDVANMQGSDAKMEMVERFVNRASDGNTSAIRNMVGFFRSVSIDERNRRGWTALMIAARNGHSETVEFLLENGADAFLMNKTGMNARQIAAFWNQKDVIKSIDKFLKPQSSSTHQELVNYFGTNVADRQSYLRKNTKYIESLKSLESTRYVIFADLEMLKMHNNPSGEQGILFLSQEQINNLETKEHDIIFLGKGCVMEDDRFPSQELQDIAYFAVNLRKMPTEEEFPAGKLFGKFASSSFVSLLGLRAEEAGLVGQALSILSWHDRYRYCPTCGSETEMIESGYKRSCSNMNCRSHNGTHNTCFPRTDPVVIVLVVSRDGTKCLLGRQARFPPRMYSCLAGFMEPGETIEDAARREIMEESGIKVGRLDYHSSQPWPFPGQLMIGLIGHALTEEITVDQEELDDAKWFTRTDVAEALAGGFAKREGLVVAPRHAIAHQLMKAWVQMSSNL